MPVRLLPVGTACNPCLTVFANGIHAGKSPGVATLVSMTARIFWSFNPTDSTILRLAKQDPFACTMLNELDEDSVGFESRAVFKF